MPTKKYYEGKIPFQDFDALIIDGKKIRPARSVQLDYADFPDKKAVWKDNVKFFARLTIQAMSRGRSAANFLGALSEVEVPNDSEMSKFLEGKEINLFMIDMLDLITNTVLTYGTTSTLLFTFCKRGMSYGLTRVK